MTEPQIKVPMSHVANFEKALDQNSIPFEMISGEPSTLTGEIYDKTFTILGDSKNVTVAKDILLNLETLEFNIRVTRKKMHIVSDLASKYKVKIVQTSPVKIFGATLYYKLSLKGRDVDLGGIAMHLHYS